VEVLAHFGDYALLAEVAPGLYSGRRLRAPHPGPVFIELAQLLGPQQQAQLRARANLIGRASHLRLAPLIEAGTVAERSYAVYGFQPGTSLSRALQVSQAHDHQPSIEWSVRAFAAVLDGLECLHLAMAELPKAQALHGHLGPASLVVTEQDELSLVELAVARGAGQGPGVPGYAAPEQVLEGEVDRRADLFAIGCLFFECVIGRPYLVGVDDRARLAAAADPPPLPKLDRPELAAILASALDPDPHRRFSRAADFAEALRRLELGPARTTHGTQTRPFAFGYPGDELEARTLAGQHTQLRDFYVEGDPIPSWSSAELSSTPTPEITRPIRPPPVRPEPAPRSEPVPSAGPWPKAVWGLVVAALIIGVALGLRLAERDVAAPTRPVPPLVAADGPAPIAPKVVPAPPPEPEPEPESEPPPEPLEAQRPRPRPPKPPPPATVVAPKPPPAPPPPPSVRALIDRARAAREDLPPGDQRRQLDALLGKLAFKAQARVTPEEHRALEQELRRIIDPRERP
jgi:hypothetical protein